MILSICDTMPLRRRSPEFEKQETENWILFALQPDRRDPSQKKKLRFTQLLEATDLPRATLNRALKRMQEKRNVEREVEASRGKPVEIYYSLGPKAAKEHAIEPSTMAFSMLGMEHDLSRLPPKLYLKKVGKALCTTLLDILIRSLRESRPILAEPVVNQFRLQIGNYVIYRKNRKLRDPRVVAQAFAELKNYPEKFNVQLAELERSLHEIGKERSK